MFSFVVPRATAERLTPWALRGEKTWVSHDPTHKGPAGYYFCIGCRAKFSDIAAAWHESKCRLKRGGHIVYVFGPNEESVQDPVKLRAIETARVAAKAGLL